MIDKEELYWSHNFNQAKLDKNVFGPGPWMSEPDRVWYLDDETGFYCLIYRHHHLGCLSGYIGIPKGHPWHYQNLAQLSYLNVHGGITYAENNGFNMNSYYSLQHKFVGPLIETHSNLDGKLVLEPSLWLVGFDTCHFMDLVPAFANMPKMTRQVQDYKDVSYMEDELKSLCKQALEALD